MALDSDFLVDEREQRSCPPSDFFYLIRLQLDIHGTT